MRKLLFTLFIVSIIYSCNTNNKSNVSVFQLIPESSSVVIKINDLETFKSDVKNNTFLKSISETDLYNTLSLSKNSLERINTDNVVFLCFDGDSNYTILTKLHDSLIRQSEDTLKLHHKTVDSIFIATTNATVLESLVINEKPFFNELDNVLNEGSSFSILLNETASNNIGHIFFNNSNTNFTNLTSLDFKIEPDQVNFNGVGLVNDTLPKFVSVFKNTIPQENTIAEITPFNSNGFSSFTYDDFQTLHKNLALYRDQEIDSTSNYELLETITEIGEIYSNNGTVLVLKSIDAFSTNTILNNEENISTTYRNINIYNYNDALPFHDIFTPLLTIESTTHYINIGDFFAFANNEDILKDIIANYQNGSTLNNDRNYNNLLPSLSDEASFLVVANSATLKHIIEKTFNESISNINLNNHKFSGFQLIQDDGFVHINGTIKKNKLRAQQNTITEEFNVALDNDLLSNPQFVINHRTKQKEIVVQDVNNHLYLISNKGKVLWKKQLKGPVLGNIEQIDLYKNGRLQLAFATPDRVYIIDRNGNDVSPFPLKFNNKITQPLSVFDYDNNKNYRFAVIQNNVLIMYDRNGKRVNGFRYNNSNEDITTQAKHFRINNKDYIVFASGNTLKILNRRGQVRVNVNETINFSGNPIYRYNDAFTTTSTNGDLVQIDFKGRVTKQASNLTSNHNITATSKTLASLVENKLTIRQRSQELDFGNYTPPKIFYLNDKIYVTLTDLQSQKIYMFDSQSKPISNFPVYGNSIIDMANIDNDRNLEFVTKGESNSIIVYQKN